MDKRLTVQWILNGCGLERGSITGGPVRFHEISRRWRRDGRVDQHLLTTSGGAGMLRGMGCELPMSLVRASWLARRERLRATRLWSYVLSALDGSIRVVRMSAPDVVVTVSDYFCDIVPALTAKRRFPCCRWIAWIHHREQPPGRRPGNRLVNTLTWHLQQWSFRRIAAHADQVWILDTDAGDQVQEALASMALAVSRTRRMRNGLDLGFIRQIPVPGKRVDAVIVGVRPNKGLHDILPIWREVLRRRPGATLRLMGGMSGEARLIDEIKRSGLATAIEILRPPGGYLPPAEYYRAIKEASLFLAPSHEEGWGIAVWEALACDVPVIAYDLPAYRRELGNVLCRVPCFDVASFARSISAHLDRLAEGSRKRDTGWSSRLAAFDWDRIAEEDGDALIRVCAPDGQIRNTIGPVKPRLDPRL